MQYGSFLTSNAYKNLNIFVELTDIILNEAEDSSGTFLKITPSNTNTILNNKIIITNCFASNNKAQSGGILHILYSELIVISSQLNNNSGTLGGVARIESCTIEFVNVSMISNFADYEGGSIYINNSSLILNSCNISNSYSEYNGGSIYSYKSNISISNSIIANSSTLYSGGGIAFNLGQNINDNGGITLNLNIDNNAVGIIKQCLGYTQG
eukprot:235488_1